MMRRGLIITLCTFLFVLGGDVCADTLLLDSIAASPDNSAQGIPRPSRGMSMERVKDRFGEPSKIHPSIGNPPITRWDYVDYSVFFEYRHVLTAVVHHE